MISYYNNTPDKCLETHYHLEMCLDQDKSGCSDKQT